MQVQVGSRVQVRDTISPVFGHALAAGGAGQAVGLQADDRWPTEGADVVVLFDDGRRRRVPAAHVTVLPG